MVYNTVYNIGTTQVIKEMIALRQKREAHDNQEEEENESDQDENDFNDDPPYFPGKSPSKEENAQPKVGSFSSKQEVNQQITDNSQPRVGEKRVH